MAYKILINGFGRIGKLATRLAWYDHKKDFNSEAPTGIWGQELEIVGINDPNGNIQVAKHLLEFDSTHGRFPIKIYEDGKYLFLGNKKVKYSNFDNLEEAVSFHDNIDIILECSGKFKNVLSLSNLFEKKIRKIIEDIILIHDKALILDCHSMSSEIVDANTDIVLSNNLGKSADLIITDKLKSFFNNSDIFSIWNIFYELQQIRQRGYYGQELVIKLNKYLSLPLLLFSMIILSTVFTIKTNYTFNNFILLGALDQGSNIIDNLKTVPPGSVLEYKDKKVEIKEYNKHIVDGRNDSGHSFSEIFKTTLEDQLTAEVPVNVLLSGGIDSFLISYFFLKTQKIIHNHKYQQAQ